ncbi:maleylpyruvate isomerase N-terminal domain-containing protein [Brachybacterium sp. AOP42-C2-15]|uniref:maleylpyruvate isomerase N-terminal domain-containing protein n=1 Tax=unclassified Brachybacterium TaxID=2623841 RepID=UPI00402AA9DC
MELFTLSWSALRQAVAQLPDTALDSPSGCHGWRVRDLVHHLVLQAQEVLIALATPAETAPTDDALSWWTLTPTLPDGHAPHDALIGRMADAYESAAQLRESFEHIAAAAGRAALLAHPDLPVSARGRTLTARDLLGALVLEATLHHLDLVAHLPGADGSPAEGPPAEGPPTEGLPAESLTAAREMVERRLRLPLPPTWNDADALRVATGRRPATPAEQAELDALGVRGQMLPLSFG